MVFKHGTSLGLSTDVHAWVRARLWASPPVWSRVRVSRRDDTRRAVVVVVAVVDS